MSDDNLRVSDTERHEMADYLQDAMSKGYLSADELAERLDRALQAKTRGELSAVARDLPAAPGAPPSARYGAQAAQYGDEATLRGTFGSVKRNGNWPVPATLRLRGRMTSFELDFTEAQIGSPVVTVDIDISGGSVEMRLPDGASASVDDVDTMMGSVEDHRKGAPPSGNPHFQLTGTARFGSIELRGPRKSLFGRKK